VGARYGENYQDLGIGGVFVIEFENGMTVADLRAFLLECPDTREDGTPCEVWISTREGTSNQAFALWRLNVDADGDFDLLLEPRQDVAPPSVTV
jgi:hypothetical protein